MGKKAETRGQDSSWSVKSLCDAQGPGARHLDPFLCCQRRESGCARGDREVTGALTGGKVLLKDLEELWAPPKAASWRTVYFGGVLLLLNRSPREGMWSLPLFALCPLLASLLSLGLLHPKGSGRGTGRTARRLQ